MHGSSSHWTVSGPDSHRWWSGTGGLVRIVHSSPGRARAYRYRVSFMGGHLFADLVAAEITTLKRSAKLLAAQASVLAPRVTAQVASTSAQQQIVQRVKQRLSAAQAAGRTASADSRTLATRRNQLLAAVRELSKQAAAVKAATSREVAKFRTDAQQIKAEYAAEQRKEAGLTTNVEDAAKQLAKMLSDAASATTAATDAARVAQETAAELSTEQSQLTAQAARYKTMEKTARDARGAQQTAVEGLDKRQQDLAAAVGRVTTERSTLQATQQRTLRRMETMKTELQQLYSQAATARGEVAQMRKRLSDAMEQHHAKLQELEGRVPELEQQARLLQDEAEREADKYREESMDLRKLKDEGDTAQRDREAKLADHENRRQQLELQVTVADHMLRDSAASVTSRKAKLDEVSSRMQVTQARRRKIMQELQELEARRRAAAGAVHALMSAVEAQRDDHADVQARHAALAAEFKAQKRQLALEEQRAQQLPSQPDVVQQLEPSQQQTQSPHVQGAGQQSNPQQPQQQQQPQAPVTKSFVVAQVPDRSLDT